MKRADIDTMKSFIRSQKSACLKDAPQYLLYWLQGVQSTLVAIGETESAIFSQVQDEIKIAIRAIEGDL
jgi:hypothetical protein